MSKFLQSDLSVLCVIHSHLLHGKHHLHDLCVDLNVLCKKYVPAFKLCLWFVLGLCFFLLLVCAFVFLDHIACKYRLWNKAVHTCVYSLVKYIVPLVSSDDYYCRVVTNDLSYLPCGLYTVHLRHFKINKYKLVRLVPRLAYPDLLNSLSSRKHRLTAYSLLFKHKLCVLTGNRVIVYDKYAHFADLYVNVVVPVASGLCRIHKSDRNEKCGALALFTLDLYVAVHHLNNVFGDSQTKPRAAVFICGWAVLLAECLKYLGQIILAHAYTRVWNGET